MRIMMGILIVVMVGGLLLTGILSAVLAGAQSENCDTELPPESYHLQEK